MSQTLPLNDNRNICLKIFLAPEPPLLSPASERRRLSRNVQVTEQKKTPAVPQTTKAASKSPAAAKKSPAAKAGSGKSVVNLAPRQAGFPGEEDSKIYLAQGKVFPN